MLLLKTCSLAKGERKEHLKIADASAISIARDNDLKIKVVSMEDLDKIDDENIGTNILAE